MQIKNKIFALDGIIKREVTLLLKEDAGNVLALKDLVAMLASVGTNKVEQRTGSSLSFNGTFEELRTAVESIGAVVEEEANAESLSGKFKTFSIELLEQQVKLAGNKLVSKIDVVLRDYSESAEKSEISNQVLGILGEYAIFDAFKSSSNTDSFEEFLKHPNVKNFTDALSAEQLVSLREYLYPKCVELAAQAIADKKVGAGASPSIAQGDSGNSPVDITTDKAEIHVKFNDSNRLFGLQAGSTDGKKQVISVKMLENEINFDDLPVTLFYKVLREKFAQKVIPEMEKKPDFKAKLETAKVDLKKTAPGGVLGSFLKIRLLDISNLELEMFKRDGYRKEYLDFLEENKIGEKIEKELKAFFKTDENEKKEILFFKYFTSPKSFKLTKEAQIRLDVIKITGDGKNLAVKPLYDADNTMLYSVTYDGNIIFEVEARTSGSGHPLQIKAVSSKKAGNVENMMEEKFSFGPVSYKASSVKESVMKFKNLLKEMNLKKAKLEETKRALKALVGRAL
jgi:hypothetical protein